MDVVDKIAAVSTTTRGPHGDVPVKPVIIESVEKI
jgi:cyclophilin family peptidyl-prolyl cis-trans isomerase